MTIILSMYFLTLNAIPWSDAGNGYDDSQVITTVDFDKHPWILLWALITEYGLSHEKPLFF